MQVSTIIPSESLIDIRSKLLGILETGDVSPEEVYNQLLESDPYDAIALVGLGSLRGQAGDSEAATSYLWRAIEAQPCLWTSYIELSRVADSLGDTALKNGLAELGLRKMRMDPQALEDFGNAPVPDDDDADLDDEEELDDPDDLDDLDEEEELSDAERLESAIDLLRDRRDLEPLDVTARLRFARLLHQVQENEDLDDECVEAVLREGEAFIPWLIGGLRSYAQNPLFEDESRMAENTLALLGEIASVAALPSLLEFCASEQNDVAGAAGWAIGRILEMQPEPASTLLHKRVAGLDVYTRIALAEVLLGHPELPTADTLLQQLAESATGLPPQQQSLLFPVVIMALVAVRGLIGREIARKLLRRNASRLDRDTRRQCTELLEAADELKSDPERLDRPRWTVYEICAGEVVWPTGEEDEEDEQEEEPGVISLVPPVKRASQPGRNDPCPCGSGKKYKKCHLDADAPF
jgi:tetratricopeptide (TPR) repeat protein